MTGAIGCLHMAKNPSSGLPELFVGYENGAIGAFRISFDTIHPSKLSFYQVISTQKMIQDPAIHHVLSLEAIYLKPGDLKLALGYYASLVQTLDFTSASDDEAYQLVGDKSTPHTYSEKAGIGCLSSLAYGSKALLVSGGFDHRVRVISAKTLKALVNLEFHQGIVNRVELEKKGENEVIVYSIAEDGYFAHWILQI